MNPDQIHYLPLKNIVTSPQVREHFDPELIEGLAASMQEAGQLVPIRVWENADDTFEVEDGGRRVRALRLAGMETVMAIIVAKPPTASGVLHKQLIANVQRSDLTPLERARGISQLMKETDWNASQVAAKLGLKNAAVSRLLPLLTLPEDIQQMVAKGDISPSAAYEISRVADPAAQAARAQEVVRGDVTRDQLAKSNKSRSKGAKAKGPASPDRATAQLGGDKSVTVTAPNLDVETFVGTLTLCIERIKACKKRGVSLLTTLKTIEEQAESELLQTPTNS